MNRTGWMLWVAGLVSIVIVACGPGETLSTSTPTPTEDDSEDATNTPQPTETQMPTATRRPTRTPTPTESAEPTETAIPASSGGVRPSTGTGSGTTGGTTISVPVDASFYIPPGCDVGTQFDPVRGFCVDPDLIDCGPVPYNFNAVSGSWERLFYEVCWHANGDAFEKMFHALNYGQVQELLVELGIDGLSHDEQVDALLSIGYLGGPSGLEPIVICSEGFELNESTGECEADLPPDCGPTPYVFNEVKGEWERDFNKWCFAGNRDPFEVLFHKMDYARVGQHLASLGLAGLTHDEQVAGLANLGYWSADGAYVPDGAPTFPR